jgi:hypothetical protein
MDIYMAENQTCLTIFEESLSCQISTESLKRYIGYMEKSINALRKLGSIMVLCGCKSELPCKY